MTDTQGIVIPDLRGKSVLITGASTGIGAAAARAFGQNGAKVAIGFNASREQAERVASDVRSTGGEALLVGGDVNHPETAARAVAETVDLGASTSWSTTRARWSSVPPSSITTTLSSSPCSS